MGDPEKLLHNTMDAVSATCGLTMRKLHDRLRMITDTQQPANWAYSLQKTRIMNKLQLTAKHLVTDENSTISDDPLPSIHKYFFH